MAFLQQIYSADTASSSTHSIVPTANTSAGNLVVHFITVGNGRTVSSVSDNAGNTWAVAVQSGGARATAILYSLLTNALTTAHTITVTLNAASPASNIVATWSGIAASPLDKFNGANTASTGVTVSTGSTGTLSQAEELVVMTLGLSGGSGGFTAEPPYTALTSPTTNFQARYTEVSATTALNETWSWNTQRSSGATIATFKMAVDEPFIPKVIFI